MGRVIDPVASGEPAWAGAVLKIPRRCMGRLRGFGSSGAALFYGELGRVLLVRLRIVEHQGEKEMDKARGHGTPAAVL